MFRDVNHMDLVKQIQEIERYIDLFYYLKNLIEKKILKIRILKQNQSSQ